MTLDREGWVKDVRSAHLFFDDERVLVCSLTSSEVNYISLGRHVRKRPGYSWEAVTVGATRWVAGNRESVEKHGRSELPLDASDDELAVAIRAAMAATSGPATT